LINILKSNNDDFIPRENPGHDPLFKLGPIFKRMISRFNSAYIPHQNISLDEGMIPWRGNFEGYRVCAPIFINVWLWNYPHSQN
jgi:hypothetical protein